MLNAQPISIWQARWEILEGMLARVPANPDVARSETIRQLRDCLQAFGARQFAFLLDGFDPQRHERHILEPSADYPADFAFNTTLNQVFYDLDVLQDAVAGRNGPDGQTLATADHLAQAALDRAIEAGFLQETAVLTYFNKSAKIRVIPYAPLALVAVPHTAARVTRDFLAIPHEVGHYVFRHGQLESYRLLSWLRRDAAGEPNWLKRWLEEIFADVYGALIGGPVMALNFQDLLLDNSRERFLRDDGVHPVAGLRPYIYTQVLAETGFAEAAAALNTRWEMWLERRGAPEFFICYAPEPDGTTAVTFASARARIEAAVANWLATLLKPLRAQSTPPWSKDSSVDELYAEFEALVAEPPRPLLAGLRAAPDDPDIVGVTRHNLDLFNLRRKGATGMWLDILVDTGRTQVALSPALWVQALAALGWNTEGPEEDPDYPD